MSWIDEDAHRGQVHLEHHRNAGGIKQDCPEMIAAPDDSDPAQLRKACQTCTNHLSILKCCWRCMIAKVQVMQPKGPLHPLACMPTREKAYSTITAAGENEQFGI